MVYILLFLAVVVGYIVAYGLKSKIRSMAIPLAFSGAFLLSMTILELLPDVFEMPTERIGTFIISGILLQICLEYLSRGAEHGHVHLNSEKRNFPWLLFISLSIHALLEGYPITDSNNMLAGVLVHKIPVAVILSFFFIRAGYKQWIGIVFLLLFALMAPLGQWLGVNFEVLDNYRTEITAVVIGIFLHVSTTIIYESSKDHKFNLAKLLTIILGFVLAYFL